MLGLGHDDLNPLSFLKYGWLAYNQDLIGKWLFALCVPPAIIAGLVIFAINSNQRNIFGRAHWATIIEAKKAGLFSKKGLIVGKKWGKHLRVGGFEHVFVFAPTGSGKSASIVIPNLFEWNGSCIIQDVKLSLFELTSGFRQKYGQACFVWNPGAHDCRTHCYNPLDFVNEDHLLRIDDLQKIAHILIPDNSDKPIWSAQPRNLFVALALYLIDTDDRPTTIGEITRIVKNSNNFSQWLTNIMIERKDLDPLCYRNFNAFVQIEKKLQANILISFLSYFELFDNPIVDAATSKSDFDIRRFRKERITVYVGVTPNNLERLSPLLTVFYQQTLDALLTNLPNEKNEPYAMLFMIDEFSALRKMLTLQKSIGLLREYRVRMMLIIQEISQLNVTYGIEGAKAFINTKIRIAFTQNDLDSSRLISAWLGNKTVEQRSRNQNSLFSDRGGFGSQSLSMTKVELMQPNEIMKLDEKKSIILVEGKAPILANKLFWYEHDGFKKRAIGAIELPKMEVTIMPFDRLEVNESEAEKAKTLNGEEEQEVLLCEEDM